jgi:hypothetical protein
MGAATRSSHATNYPAGPTETTLSQTAFFGSRKAHSTEADPRTAASVFSEDDLIGWQRHSHTAWKDDKGTRWSVPDDGKRRLDVAFAIEGGVGNELDE